MVSSLWVDGTDVPNFAETERDFLDASVQKFMQEVRFLNSKEVHPSSKKENKIPIEQGYWVDPESLPKKFLWRSDDGSIPDVLMWFIVSPRFKSLVEQFEPDVHQFVPIKIFANRNHDPIATHYWFIVGQRVDSVDRDHTTYTWEDGQIGLWADSIMDTESWEFTKIPDAKLVFSRKRTEGVHIWKDPHVMGGDRLCSSEFAKAALAAGFSGLGVSERETAGLENGDREAA